MENNMEDYARIIEDDTWEKLIQMPKDGKSKLEASTKKILLAKYEVKTGKNGGKRQLSRIPLWYFLHEILNVEHFQELISWEDRTNLTFSIRKPKELALLWGAVKNSNDTMTYPKLARGIRYYYGKGVIEKCCGKRFCYQFIRSKKTKSVLTKRTNHNRVIDVPGKQTKRSLSGSTQTQSITPILKRKQNSLDTTGASKRFDADDDNKFCLQNWKLFDSYIADFFNDKGSVKEIFNDIQFGIDNLNKADDNILNTHDSTVTTEKQLCSDDIASDLLNFCADINDLIKKETDDTQDKLLQSQIFNPSCFHSNMISVEKHSRKRSRGETSDPLLSPLNSNKMFYGMKNVTDTKLFVTPVVDNVTSKNYSISTMTTPTAFHDSSYLPDFSLLKYFLDDFDQDSFEKDCQVDYLKFEKSVMENI